MSERSLAIDLQRRLAGPPTLSLVRLKRHGAVSIVLAADELDEVEAAIAEAKRLIAVEPNRPAYEVTDLKHTTPSEERRRA